MHILITRAAGMIGRKLTGRAGQGRRTPGRQIEKLTLLDVVPPAPTSDFAGRSAMIAADISTPGEAAHAIEGRPDIIFISPEWYLVKPSHFDKGYRAT